MKYDIRTAEIEKLSESFLNALREVSESTISELAVVTLKLYSDAWIDYLEHTRPLLLQVDQNNFHHVLIESFRRYTISVNNYSGQRYFDNLPLVNVLALFNERDWEDMGTYVSVNLDKISSYLKENSLVGCDTVADAIKHAKTLGNYNDALKWAVIWEHERTLKSGSVDTLFCHIIENLDQHFNAKVDGSPNNSQN